MNLTKHALLKNAGFDAIPDMPVPLITVPSPITDYFFLRTAGKPDKIGQKRGVGCKCSNNNQRLTRTFWKQVSGFASALTDHASTASIRINVRQCTPMLAKTRFKNIFEPPRGFGNQQRIRSIISEFKRF